ncbi:MAG: hypothetical protein WCI20_08675, partial [bacterium]
GTSWHTLGTPAATVCNGFLNRYGVGCRICPGRGGFCLLTVSLTVAFFAGSGLVNPFARALCRSPPTVSPSGIETMMHAVN